MKRLLTIFTIVVAIVVDAATETINGVKWTYSISNGEAIIGKDSYSAAIPTATTGVIVVPETLGGCPVTAIGDGAFYNCKSLQGVIMQDNISSIGQQSFSYCSSLLRVMMSNNITNIGNYAFSHCLMLDDVSLPSKLKSIGNGLFSGCSFLSEISYTGNDCEISDYMFEDCISLTSLEISQSLERIGYGAFSGCANLKEISISGDVANIENCAFVNCGKLERITVLGHIYGIGNAAFYNCYKLGFDTVTIKGVKLLNGWVVGYEENLCGDLDLEGICGIAGGSFSGCTGITSVTIPSSVKSIGHMTFENCTSLTNVSMTESLETVGVNAFAGCIGLADNEGFVIVKDVLYDYLGKESDVIIPEGVKGIDHGFLSSRDNITSVRMPNSVKEIFNSYYFPPLHGTFSDCHNLTNIVVGANIESIPPCMCEGCDALTEIEFPNTVASIYVGAFDRCPNIKRIRFRGNAPYIYDGIAFGENKVFCGVSEECVVYIPYDASGYEIDDDGKWRGMTVAYYGIDDSGIYEMETVGEYTWRYRSNSYGAELVAIQPNNTNVYSPVPTVSPRPKGRLTIPSELGGLPVTCIGKEAFYGCSDMTSITIPESVTSIKEDAFVSCYGLTDIMIPSSVTNIVDGAFYMCSCLQSIAVAEENAHYKSVDGLLLSKDGSTLICGNAGVVTVPNGVTRIAPYAFGYFLLEEVSIPESVSSIGQGAFFCCSGLTSVRLPSHITRIEYGAFYGCVNLERVVFMGDAPVYVSNPYAFDRVAKGCVAYVPKGSSGWGVSEGELWNGLILTYWEPGLPEVTNESDVGAAISGAVDDRLPQIVSNVEQYSAYRDWALQVKSKNGELAGDSFVKSSPHAVASYLLGSTMLFENEPIIDVSDVNVAEGAGNEYEITLSVTVRDGAETMAVAKEKVAAMFEATSSLDDWQSEGSKLTPMVESLEGDGDTMRFKVKPGDGTAKSAFIRIRR